MNNRGRLLLPLLAAAGWSLVYAFIMAPVTVLFGLAGTVAIWTIAESLVTVWRGDGSVQEPWDAPQFGDRPLDR